MHTKVTALDWEHPAAHDLEEAAGLIRSGALVAFPTETVYGLGADAFNEAACRNIYTVKGRAATDPCIVHIDRLSQLDALTLERPKIAETLAQAFWPGPLSLVLQKSPAVPDVITAGLPTVAVRMPAHPVALALLERSATPIAAPSANVFGHTSPTTAQHVVDDLGGRIPLVLDAGPTAIGVESTVLDLAHGPPRLLRPGGVTVEQLQDVLGSMVVTLREAAEEERQSSPGMLSKHYAPSVPLRLFEGPATDALKAMAEAAQDIAADGRRVGVLLADEDTFDCLSDVVRILRVGSERDLDGMARGLYAALRELEREGVAAILARSFEPAGRGMAINDRLRRAAAGGVIRLEADR